LIYYLPSSTIFLTDLNISSFKSVYSLLLNRINNCASSVPLFENSKLLIVQNSSQNDLYNLFLVSDLSTAEKIIEFGLVLYSYSLPNDI
jgi:hypothetical protein